MPRYHVDDRIGRWIWTDAVAAPSAHAASDRVLRDALADYRKGARHHLGQIEVCNTNGLLVHKNEFGVPPTETEAVG